MTELMMPLAQVIALPAATAGACRICGCTDTRACPGGCHWIAPELCSRCADLLVDDATDLLGDR